VTVRTAWALSLEKVTIGAVIRRSSTLAAAAAAVLAVAVPAGAGAGRAAAPSRLHVDLAEWALVPSGGLVASGPLELTVRNVGRVPHELAIIATESWGQPLFVRNGRAVGPKVGRAVVVRPGQTRTARVYLSPGAYVLLDNLRGHYRLGAAVSIVAR
jgi:hypothetical protein